MKAKHHALHRRKSRGVAMLESSLVMFVYAGVLGMLTYSHMLFEAKIKTNLETRANAVDVASHNCESNTSSSTSLLEMGVGMMNEYTDATSNAGTKSGNTGATEVLGKLSKAASSVLKLDVAFKGWSRSLTSSTKMTCNEKPFDGNIGSWFSYAAKAFTGFGADKFP